MNKFIEIDEVFQEEREIPDVTDVIDMDMLKHRTIFLEGDIDEDLINATIRRLVFLSRHTKEPITIRLCTDGGECYEAIRLYDACRQIKNPVNIIASGRVFSAGVFILACCATGKRMATKHTSFMTHEVSSGAYGKFSDLKVSMAETERIQNLMNKLISEHTKMTVKQVEALDVKDNYFDAKKAKKLGIIEKIL